MVLEHADVAARQKNMLQAEQDAYKASPKTSVKP